MNQNSLAIQVMCSHIAANNGAVPYEAKEWNELAVKLHEELHLQPQDLLTMSRDDLKSKLNYSDEQADRVLRLIDRSAALSFELSEYENTGIKFVTRADKVEYPARLKQILKSTYPPVFCYAGNLSILKNASIGFVGSRSINEADIKFTQTIAETAVSKGYAIVSGGAKGVDTVAINTALNNGGKAIAYLSDSFSIKLKNMDIRKHVQNGNLILLSAVKPDAPWNVGNAMARNKYIYAQSLGTVVVKADYDKGGTWAGATENIRNRWVPVYCWDNKEYKGNQALIGKGAVPISEAWDCESNPDDVPTVKLEPENKQISMFDQEWISMVK